MLTPRLLRIKAMHHLFSLHMQQRALAKRSPSLAELEALQGSLSAEIKKISCLHTSFLHLLTTWVALEREESNLLIDPPSPHLASDPLLARLASDSLLTKALHTYPPIWSTAQLTRWYPTYRQAPLKIAEESNPAARLAIPLIHHLFQDPLVQEAATLADIHWHEDKEIVYTLLIRFLKAFAQKSPTPFYLYENPLTPAKEHFYRQLVTQTATKVADHYALLSDHIPNWSITRIHNVDLILIRMALTEIASLPDIPIRVSFNEYIEIAKQYSTPKSSAFINGTVDSILKSGALPIPSEKRAKAENQ